MSGTWEAGTDPGSMLIAEQLAHTVDLLRGEIAALRSELEHQREVSERRLAALEKGDEDHEARLRQAQEVATQFRLLASLTTGGGLLGLISLIKVLGGL